MSSVDPLTEINLDDLVASFGWQDNPRLASLLRVLFRGPAARFARQMKVYDRRVAETCLPAASRETLREFAQDLRVYGAENIPTGGPILFLSNHPGMVDTLALFAAIGREDLRIIALNRPFLRSLPNITQHLYFVGEQPAERINAVRQAAQHLRRSGGAVLTFPAGHIEPDAAVYDGALEALESWNDSAGVFLRFAPETRILPVFVRGVLWRRAVLNPLTGIKRTRDDRERLGAALQLLAHVMLGVHPLQVSVQFAAPLTLREIGTTDTTVIQTHILERMRGLAQSRPVGQGRSI